MDDKTIVALFQQRQEQAIAAAEEKYGRLCRQIAWNILQNHEDAEECVSDAFWKAWNSIPPALPVSLCAYLCTLVRRTSLHRYHYNSAGRRNQQLEILFSELEECLPSHCETENEAETRAALSVINRTLSGLRAEQRALFIRRYYLSESIKEIAVFYQISETKVKQTLFRIRKKMKEELMKEGISI